MRNISKKDFMIGIERYIVDVLLVPFDSYARDAAERVWTDIQNDNTAMYDELALAKTMQFIAIYVDKMQKKRNLPEWF